QRDAARLAQWLARGILRRDSVEWGSAASGNDRGCTAAACADGRRSSLARYGDAARGADEARRRPETAAAPDGGDGAAGLRPVRLSLQELRGSDRERQRESAQPLRTRRQGN